MNCSDALCLFIKFPEPGLVKTRLQPELSPQEATALYRAMVEDLVQHFRNQDDVDTIIYYWPPDSEEIMRDWLGSSFQYVSQRGKDLGEKMVSGFSDAFERDYRRVILIGSDVPFLDGKRIDEALFCLQDYDLVLGPTEDGGYYLMGMRELHPALFKGISWSTDRVLEQTMTRVKGNNLSVRLLDKMADVDTFHDVRVLWDILDNYNQRGRLDSLERTHHVLKKIFENIHLDDM